MVLSTFSPHRLLGIADLPHAMRFSVLQGILVLSWALPSALLPVQALELLGDAQTVSLFFFATGFAGLVGVLAAPWLIYAFGRRAVFCFGTGCVVISSACLSFDQVSFLIAGAAGRSLGYMCIDVTFEVVIMERIPRRALARFEAARVFCFGFGLIIGPWLGVKLALDFHTWVTYLIVSVLISGLCLYIMRVGLIDSPSAQGSGQVARPAPPNPFRFVRRFLHQPRLRLAWILSFGRAGWWTMYFIYTPIYCVQTGLGAELGGIIVSLAALPLLLVPLWGRLARRIGVRPMLGLGFLTTGLLTLVVATASPWTGVGLLLVAAVCASLLDAVGNALFLRAARPLERAEMASVFFTYREAAQLIPPGILAGLLGFFALPVVFVASGCGMVALTWLTRHIPRRF